MSSHPLQIFTGSSHPHLAAEIAHILGTQLGKSTTTILPDGEIHVRIDEVVRGKKVVVTNTLPVPDEKQTGKIEVVSIAPLLAGIIYDIHEERSISPKMVFW